MDPELNPPSSGGIVESIDGQMFTTEKARKLAMRMFGFGFAFLPMLWFVNIWLFWHEFRGGPTADAVVKRYTRWSLYGFIVYTALFLPWFFLYITAGWRILNPDVYHALDCVSWDLPGFLGI